MPFEGCKVSINMSRFFENLVSMLLRNVTNECKTQDMGERIALKNPWALKYVPFLYKTHEIFEKCVEKELYALR